MAKQYKVEVDFMHEGFRCIVTMGRMGSRCGYVGIDESHPLYAKDYQDKYGKFSDISNSVIGKRSPLSIMCLALDKVEEDTPIPISAYFDVHGGITYAGGGVESNYPIDSNLWWFGYDCNHCDDARDMSCIQDIYVLEMGKKYPTGGTVRSLEYCKDECESLASQLSKIK